MGNILRPNKKLQLPNGLAEQREREEFEKILPLAKEEAARANADFQTFLDEHNVTFEVHFDERKTVNGTQIIGQGLTFISKLLTEKQSPVIH